VKAGTATCALCHEAIRPDADVVLSPDFIAEDSDPLFCFSNAAIHRACFAVWGSRKTFVLRFNRVAAQLRYDDGTYLHMTAEGDLVRRRGGRPRTPPPPA